MTWRVAWESIVNSEVPSSSPSRKHRGSSEQKEGAAQAGAVSRVCLRRPARPGAAGGGALPPSARCPACGLPKVGAERSFSDG